MEDEDTPAAGAFTRGGGRPVPLDDDELERPELADRPAPGQVSALDVIRAELEQPVDLGTVDLEVPARPVYKVRYRCEVAYEELLDWRDRATITNRSERRKPTAQATAGRLNELKMASFVLVHRCIAILRDGEEVPDGYGGPLMFTSELLLDMVGARTAVEAVRKFYGVDGHVSAAANRVLVEAGWTDQVLAGEIDAPADPTHA